MTIWEGPEMPDDDFPDDGADMLDRVTFVAIIAVGLLTVLALILPEMPW